MTQLRQLDIFQLAELSCPKLAQLQGTNGDPPQA